MGRYRKIDPRIWNDAKFSSLSHEGQRLFLYVLTHPSMTSLGAFRATPDGLMAEIGINDEQCNEHCREQCTEHRQNTFDELLVKELVKYDEKSKTVFAPNFIKYNAPENANVVIGWENALDQIPEGSLKLEAIEKAKASVMIPKKRSKSEVNTLLKAFNERLTPILNSLKKQYESQAQTQLDTVSGTVSSTECRIQEQEQEQYLLNTNKHIPEVSEAIEAPTDESVCCVSSDEDVFDEFDFIDTPIKQQVEQVQLEHFNAQDASKPLTLTELIVACKTYGIKLSHTPKTEAIAARQTITPAVLEEAVKLWKGTATTTGYFIGILENASKDPNSIMPHEKREKPQLTAETITDKQAGYFASRLVKDTSFCSTFGVGHQSFDSFIDQVTRRLHDPVYFNEYLPWMQKHGFV